MKNRLRHLSSTHLLVLALLLLLPSVASANAWLRSEGEHLIYTSLSYSTSYRYWDRNGDRRDKSDRSKNYGASFHYEYGLSYYYTIYAGTDYAMNTYADEESKGIGDLSLGVRGRINKLRNGRAWHLTAIVPTGYSRDINQRLGYGRFGLEGGVAFQFLDENTKQTIKSHGEWGAAVRMYEGPPATQFRTYVKWNQDLSADPQGWGSWAKLEGNFSPLDDGEEEPGVDATSDHFAEYDVVSGEIGLKHPLFTNWSFSAALHKNLWGRNASQSWGARIGLSTSWQ